MRRPVQRPEEARKLSMPCQQQLNCYAVAAVAAGVSMMALAGQSEGKVVYTPTHRVISDGSSFKLDLNADGTTDLTIQNRHYSHCTTDFCSTWQSLVANMPGGNQVVYNVFGAVAMKPGMRIGPKTVWRGGKQNMAVMLAGLMSRTATWA